MEPENNEAGWWRFLTLCKQLKTEKELNDLFHLFLTIDEREDLADRYLIIRDLLKTEHTQRDIAKRRKVSIAKITRGSNMLKTLDQKWKDFLKLVMT